MTNEANETKNQNTGGKPSISMAIFLCWVLPIGLIAALSRFGVNSDPLPPRSPDTIPLDMNSQMASGSKPSLEPSPEAQQVPPKKKNAEPSEMPTILANKPTSYIKAVQNIERMRLDWEDNHQDPMGRYAGSPNPFESVQSSSGKSQSSSSSSSSSSPKSNKGEKEEPMTPPRGASTDPERVRYQEQIEILRQEHKSNPEEITSAFSLAEALRMYDVQYHDGGTVQEEALETFHKAIELATNKRETMISHGEETSPAPGVVDPVYGEMGMNLNTRSIDGLLCGLYTSLGKAYFMANMFEKAVESYTEALKINPVYLDAIASRGSSYIILGDYTSAGNDMYVVMKKDNSRRFLDVFTGLARTLQAKESAVPQGWSPMIAILDELIPGIEMTVNSSGIEGNEKFILLQSLNRLYHVMFVYHDVKTKNVDLAWDALTKSYHYKMQAVDPWDTGFEQQKVSTTKSIFNRNFFPEGVGSNTRTPIFIIGFVRSGSTLLERVLDAHPQIVGTGENSVFNGKLDDIRNRIVEASIVDSGSLASVIGELADEVVAEQRNRWQMIASAEDRAAGRDEPKCLVDKMLTNYYNVGFIHMLFPNALILHVAREPMDTLLSAYKHEFPPGSLDYTSKFESLAELYHSYRELMDHWDRALPGRVTHIRYEDMVHDMPGVARKIIDATGLEWDDSVLDFHKKKHAVNTLSTTQVRKGVYKDSLQAWRKYETHLKPLMDLVGDEVAYDLKTTLPGYSRPAESSGNEEL